VDSFHDIAKKDSGGVLCRVNDKFALSSVGIDNGLAKLLQLGRITGLAVYPIPAVPLSEPLQQGDV
jgi:hypothetical protein